MHQDGCDERPGAWHAPPPPSLPAQAPALGRLAHQPLDPGCAPRPTPWVIQYAIQRPPFFSVAPPPPMPPRAPFARARAHRPTPLPAPAGHATRTAPPAHTGPRPRPGRRVRAPTWATARAPGRAERPPPRCACSCAPFQSTQPCGWASGTLCGRAGGWFGSGMLVQRAAPAGGSAGMGAAAGSRGVGHRADGG